MASLKRNKSANSSKKSQRNQPDNEPPKYGQPLPRPPRQGYEHLVPRNNKSKKTKNGSESTKAGKTAPSTRQVTGKQNGGALVRSDSSLCPERQDESSDSDENYEKLEPPETVNQVRLMICIIWQSVNDLPNMVIS